MGTLFFCNVMAGRLRNGKFIRKPGEPDQLLGVEGRLGYISGLDKIEIPNLNMAVLCVCCNVCPRGLKQWVEGFQPKQAGLSAHQALNAVGVFETVNQRTPSWVYC